jgi:hypothetical protein
MVFPRIMYGFLSLDGRVLRRGCKSLNNIKAQNRSVHDSLELCPGDVGMKPAFRVGDPNSGFVAGQFALSPARCHQGTKD